MCKIELPVLICKRCSHTWIPRVTNVRVCPFCKSPYWNKGYSRRRVRNKAAGRVVSKRLYK